MSLMEIRVSASNISSNTDYMLGILIGAGGFAEITIIGMTAWILKQFTRCESYDKKRFWIKDLFAINIGVLVILYWNYVDPTYLNIWSIISDAGTFYCDSSSQSALINAQAALTWKEATKAICFVLFALICNHTEIIRVKKLVLGIASGFLLYVIPTLAGSIILQGFRMGGNKIYNIFTNDLTAQSTTAGYLVITAIAIFLACRSLLVYPSLLIGGITGVQASDKSVLLIVALAVFYLYGAKFWHQRKNNEGSYFGKYVIFGTVLLATIGILKFSPIIQQRLPNILGERSSLYIRGYGNLARYFNSASSNPLADAGINEWWHSVPLDAARAAGIIGGITALLWFGVLILSLIVFVKRGQYRFCFLTFSVLIIYMTSLPLQTGAYEFIGLATGSVYLINQLYLNPPKTS